MAFFEHHITPFFSTCSQIIPIFRKQCTSLPRLQKHTINMRNKVITKSSTRFGGIITSVWATVSRLPKYGLQHFGGGTWTEKYGTPWCICRVFCYLDQPDTRTKDESILFLKPYLQLSKACSRTPQCDHFPGLLAGLVSYCEKRFRIIPCSRCKR